MGAVKWLLKFFFWTVLGVLLVCTLFLGSLFFRDQRVPDAVVARFVDAYVPTSLVVHVESVSFGFQSGVHLRGVRVYDLTDPHPMNVLASVDALDILPFEHRVVADRLFYSRLPASYYAPENIEKNAPVEVKLPHLPTFELVLTHPDILAVRPERVVAEVSIREDLFAAERIRLDWPRGAEPMFLDGFCRVDLDRQEVVGEVRGSALQSHIRPLLVALDVPTSLPYVDAFTDVRGKVPAFCGWKVNLINNDFDLDLDLHPLLGKYNLVPLEKADGKIHLHVYTRGTSLNYSHTIGPIVGKGLKDEPLTGTILVEGLNGTNTVRVTSASRLPVADLLKIAGFTGAYVGDAVVGDSSCELMFHFPRAMTNNYEVMDGEGHLRIKDGQVMRMKGFKGLLDLLADKVPGVSWFTDSTQASCDYVIEKGVLKTDNIYIEGSVFSIKMFGSFDTVKEKLDFIVRVQFTKKDSVMGKIIHPLTWPFTKLLLEFKLTGSPENPQWSYLSVLDRVMEVVK